jgi:hypothetical protein
MKLHVYIYKLNLSAIELQESSRLFIEKRKKIITKHLMNALISEAEIKTLYRDYSKRLEILTPSNRPHEELLVKLDDMLGKARIALDRAEKSFEDAEHIESLMPRNAEGGSDDV